MLGAALPRTRSHARTEQTPPFRVFAATSYSADTLPVTISGFVNTANLYGGTLYAPSAQVELGGLGGDSLSTGSLVAKSVQIQGLISCISVGSATSQC